MVDESLANIGIERSVLSSLIFDPSLINENLKLLSKEHFYQKAHSDIFLAIESLTLLDKPVDEEFLKLELNRAGCFDEKALIDVLITNPSSNIRPYIDELTTYKDRRTLLHLSLKFKQASEAEDPISSAKELILSLEKGMSTDRRLPNPTNHENIQEKEVEFILKDWLPIPKNTVTIITAPGGIGKSWLVLQIAARFCLGDSSLSAFLWLSEDPKSLSKSRLTKILDKVIKTSQSGLKIDLADDPTPFLLAETHKKITADPIWYDLKRLFDPYDLIVLDPLIAFFGGDENNNSHARYFMQLFTEYAGKMGKTIIFIHHSTKGSSGSRGAGAIVDAVRLHYEVDRVKDKDGKIDDKKSHLRLIRLAKDNYAAGSLLTSSEVEREIFPPKILDDSRSKFEIAFAGGKL